MWLLINKFRDFDLGSDVVFGVQIFCLLVLAWFLGRSIVILRTELKEEGVEGVFPALSVSYMLLSCYFILIFIGSFDEIMKYYMDGFEQYYNHKFGQEVNGEYILTPYLRDELNLVNPYLKYTLLAVLSAFSCNFSKSFFTLNSLELGLLKGEKLAIIFSRWQKIVEGLFRFLIASAFILIEKELAEITSKATNYREFFASLATEMLALYIGLIVWYFLILNKLWSREKFWVWRIVTPVQFFIGLVLAIGYRSFSKMDASNLQEWKFNLTSNSKLMIILSAILIIIIVALEVVWTVQKIKEINKTRRGKRTPPIESRGKQPANGTTTTQ